MNNKRYWLTGGIFFVIIGGLLLGYSLLNQGSAISYFIYFALPLNFPLLFLGDLGREIGIFVNSYFYLWYVINFFVIGALIGWFYGKAVK